MTSSHSNTTLLLRIMPNPLRRGLPHMGCRSVLSWAANSTDINPIENLWKIVKRMAACLPTTLQQLKVSIKQAWSSITSADCQWLVDSMLRQVQPVIAANEGPTKY